MKREFIFYKHYFRDFYNAQVFLKKDNKDYLAAIRLAEKIRSEYFEELNKK